MPIPVYVSVLNSLPAAVYLLDRLAPAGSQVISPLGAPVDVVVVFVVVVGAVYLLDRLAPAGSQVISHSRISC